MAQVRKKNVEVTVPQGKKVTRGTRLLQVTIGCTSRGRKRWTTCTNGDHNPIALTRKLKRAIFAYIRIGVVVLGASRGFFRLCLHALAQLGVTDAVNLSLKRRRGGRWCQYRLHLVIPADGARRLGVFNA